LRQIYKPLNRDKRIKELEFQLASQAKLIDELSAKIIQLESELSQYRTKKNSSNSSIPPSHDPYRNKRTESLREQSNLKAGGQPGHAGSFLEKSLEPDEVVCHAPSYCKECGKDLSNIPTEFIGSRQVIDIPPIKPKVTEHQIYGKRCLCGHLTESDYPSEAHSPVCYGSNVQSLTAYLHARQYLPFERMRELYKDIFGLSISSGSLVNMVHNFANKAKVVYETIRDRISSSEVVGADETGTCISGKNGWTWGFQTPKVTYLYTIKSRAKSVIDKLFPQGFPNTILVHDCWSSYFGVTVKGHQICTAHLLRELKYLSKLYTQQWTVCFIALLLRALSLKKSLLAQDYQKPVAERIELEAQLDALLNQNINPEHKKLVVFKERIVKYRNYLFPFLYNIEVPPDNNASERAMRTYKVKQKISGLFRSEDGAKDFAIIRSVIDTTIKNTQNVWDGLRVVALIPVSE
jgi:transposase